MKNKTIKDPFGFVSAINTNKLNDPKILKTLEEMFKDKPTHNKYMEQKEEVKKIDGINCADCGCIPKNDEWYTPRSDIFLPETYCFDCGGEAEHEFWVDYGQRKMEL